jgi:H/ACA ribonucleoprotein complex subunit 1
VLQKLIKLMNKPISRGNRGGDRGRGGSRGGRGGSRGGRGGYREQFPPTSIEEVGKFEKQCENLWIYKSVHKKVLMFDSNVYDENKTLVGKVEEGI